jgi:hypothetical protein
MAISIALASPGTPNGIAAEQCQTQLGSVTRRHRRDLSTFDWYQAFSAWKLAIVLKPLCEVRAASPQPAPRSLRIRRRRTTLACKEIRPMTDSLFSVADRVVLVTGGSRGLGRAMCVGLAERGARVVIASRKLDACEELAAQIRGSGGDAFASACHVGNWESLDQVVAEATARWGRLMDSSTMPG